MTKSFKWKFISKLEADKILSNYTQTLSSYFIIEDQIHFWNSLCCLFNDRNILYKRVKTVLDLSTDNCSSPILMSFIGGDEITIYNDNIDHDSFTDNKYGYREIFEIYKKSIYKSNMSAYKQILPENIHILTRSEIMMSYKAYNIVNGLTFVLLRNFDINKNIQDFEFALSFVNKRNYLLLTTKSILELDYVHNILNQKGITYEIFQNPISNFRDKYLVLVNQ